MLLEIGFCNATHEKNVYTGKFRDKNVLPLCQVGNFALGCKHESVAKSVCSTVGTKLTLHTVKLKLRSRVLVLLIHLTDTVFSQLHQIVC